MSLPVYIGIDCGGTNIRILEVDPSTGEILNVLLDNHTRIKDFTSDRDLTDHVFSAVLKRARSLSKEDVRIGIGVAGPHNKKTLEVMKLTNSNIDGPVTFAQKLESMGFPVTLAGDLDVAAMGQSVYGHGKGLAEVITATYSTGFNFAKTHNGLLLPVSPEFGHQDYRLKSKYKCGCGLNGCLEIFVSGTGARLIAIDELKKLSEEKMLAHPIYTASFRDLRNKEDKEYSTEEVLEAIAAEHVYQAYRERPTQKPQSNIRRTQVEAIALSFSRMMAAYNPIDRIVCIGSMSEKDGDLLIEPAAKRFREHPSHHPALSTPEVIVNEIPDIGSKGAVAYFINYHPSEKLAA